MRILFVGNNKTERCGVAEWGRHCVAAFRKLGHEVFEWHCPAEPNFEHLDYDVTFVNWHAGTISSLDARILKNHSRARLVSAYLHESSPAWNEPQHRPPLLDQVDVAFVDHPSVLSATHRDHDVIYFRTPVWDVAPQRNSQKWALPVSFGVTGIRGEGVDALVDLLRYHPDFVGTVISRSWPSGWKSAQDEVDRLASCWINVAWYGAGFGGQASAMGALIAAGQPILINSNRMLETWREFAEQETFAKGVEYTGPPIRPQLYLSDDLEAGLLEILADIRDGKARRPTWLREAFSWPKQAKRLVEAWERRLR